MWSGAVLVGAFAAAQWAMAGFGVVTVISTVVALALVWVAAFDLPISTVFTADRCVRRSLARRLVVEWDDVDRVVRVGGVGRRGRRTGGLYAIQGRRRTMLTDHTEHPIEFDRVRAVLGGDRSAALDLTAELRPIAPH